MCGFAGFLDREPTRPTSPHLLGAMRRAIDHRGPDAAGEWNGPGIGLAHARLSIVDLAGGAQPMGSEDGTVQVVFNGEIYNHRELRSWLEGRGHRFASQSDTEVLVHGYEEEGEAFVTRLRGMFAFAAWDSRRQTMLFARDRLGIKPLYLHRTRDRVVFGSQPKAILADPEIPRRIHPEALEDYLCFGMVLAPRSIFAGIEQLPAAHTLVIRRGEHLASPRRYWAPSLEPIHKNAEEWAAAVHDKVHDAVARHLMADVPLGAFLSGGVDSSIIVSAMSRHTTCPFHTFTMGFEDPRVSEISFARVVASRYQTQHHEETVTPDAASLLDQLTTCFDEPFADTSAMPTFLVSKLAARHVKVALSGDGADESFGGYPRYSHDLREHALRQRLPDWLRRWVLRPAGVMWPRTDWLPRPMRLRSTLQNLGMTGESAYANSLAYCRQPLRRRLLSGDVVRHLDGHDPMETLRRAHALAPGNDALAGMIAADLSVLLPDGYLLKIDRASMANGLEVRPPFLDHELVELACRIPSELKVTPGGEGKKILKRAFRDEVPAGNINRPKRGFNVPIDAWMRGPLREMFHDEALNPNGPAAGLLNMSQVHRVARQHTGGFSNHGQLLWSLLVLSHWAGRYLPAGPEPSRSPPTVRKATTPTVLMTPEPGPSSRTIAPIRVGFAIHVMQVAGAEVLIEETIRRLGPAIEPTILCLDAIGTIGERLIARGVPVICLNRKPGRDWGVARRMADEIKKRRIQVMHAHQYTPFFYSALAKVWLRGSFKLIQTEHGRHYPDIVDPLRRCVNRVVFDKLADASNACCLFSAKALCRNDGFVGSKIGVIENGVELSRYRPDRDVVAARRLIGLDPARRHIGCVARFHPVKDHAMLLRAFARLAAKLPDVDLVFAGEGQLRPDLERQAAEAGITHRVKFLGVRTDVPDVLAALDLFALASVSEAASLTLMEAMATARPSVVTNVGGNPELVRQGIDGLLVPRGDDEACAVAMMTILGDPKLAASMGEAARRRAETTFNLDVTVRAYYDLYAKLTGRSA